MLSTLQNYLQTFPYDVMRFLSIANDAVTIVTSMAVAHPSDFRFRLNQTASEACTSQCLCQIEAQEKDRCSG